MKLIFTPHTGKAISNKDIFKFDKIIRQLKLNKIKDEMY